MFVIYFNFYFSFHSYWCISISTFASLVDIPTGIMSSTIGLNICAIIAKIKK